MTGRRVLWWLALTAMLSTVLWACAEATGVDIEPQNPELVAAGSDLFAASCAECHGADLRGTDAGPPLLSFLYEPNHHGAGAFRIAVMAGVPQHHWDFGSMPPIEGLTDADVEAIVAFVREQQRIEGFEPHP